MIAAAKIGISIYWLASLAWLIFPLPFPDFLPRWSIAALVGFILFLHVLEFLWFRSKHSDAATLSNFLWTMPFGFAHLLPIHQMLAARRGVQD